MIMCSLLLHMCHEAPSRPRSTQLETRLCSLQCWQAASECPDRPQQSSRCMAQCPLLHIMLCRL